MDTKEAIKQEFLKEYRERDFSRITVKGLCASTPVARTTFYSYFNNTGEVLGEIEEDIIKGLLRLTDSISGGKLPDMDFSLYMDAVESFIKEHWSEIYALLVIQTDPHFIRRWKVAIKLNFRRRYPEKQNVKNYDAIAEIIASAVLSAYIYWMEHPDTSSTSEMKPLIQKLLDSLVSFL